MMRPVQPCVLVNYVQVLLRRVDMVPQGDAGQQVALLSADQSGHLARFRLSIPVKEGVQGQVQQHG